MPGKWAFPEPPSVTVAAVPDAVVQDRTFDDLVRSGRFSKRAFIETVDRVVDEMMESRMAHAPASEPLTLERWIRLLIFVERRLHGPARVGLRAMEFVSRMKAILFDPRFRFSENLRRAGAFGARAARLARQEAKVSAQRKVEAGLWGLKRVYARFPIVWPAWRALRAGWRQMTGGSHDHFSSRSR